MARDELYRTEGHQSPFRFDQKVAEVFDDMLQRSVPGYSEALALTARLLSRRLRAGDRICDLGCATGTAMLSLACHVPIPDLHWIGVDNAPAMLDKARHKAALLGCGDRCEFVLKDILAWQAENVGACLLGYTLQFVEPGQREDFLHRVHAMLRPGGTLILQEKICFPNRGVQELFTECHHDFKRRQGYSELEISRKRDALESVLSPLGKEENLALLERAGFQERAVFFQWFNFCSIVALRAQ